MALLRHESDLLRAEWAPALPARSLRPYVRGYTGYVEHAPRTMRRREIPSDTVVTIVNLGPRLRVEMAAEPVCRPVLRQLRVRAQRLLRAHRAREGPNTATCDAAQWAACFGGAMQRDDYRYAIESAGFQITKWRANTRVPLRSRARGQRDPEVRCDEHLAARPTPLRKD